jgi:citrate lyase subunit beta/citryl-CoA lyase
MMGSPVLGPSLLFCPGDRPDRFTKAFARADSVILDLEDSVGPAGKAAARTEVAAAAAAAPERAIVRVNGSTTEWFAQDVETMRRAGVRTLMLPKAAEPEQLAQLTDFDVIVLVETAAGALAISQLVQSENCIGVMWGGEDLLADLGGRSSRGLDGRYRPLVEQVRSTCLLAAAAAGKAAVDAVHIDISDLEGLRRESQEASELGFHSKACIHPSHVDHIRTAFQPGQDQLDWAHAVLFHPDAAAGGVFRIGDQMIDGPLLAHARHIIERSR